MLSPFCCFLHHCFLNTKAIWICSKYQGLFFFICCNLEPPATWLLWHFGLKRWREMSAKSLSLCLIVCFFCLNVHPHSLVSALLDTCYPSSISAAFSSEHGLSYYLIKHPGDALEVIGFRYWREGTQRGICLCVCMN